MSRITPSPAFFAVLPLTALLPCLPGGWGCGTSGRTSRAEPNRADLTPSDTVSFSGSFPAGTGYLTAELEVGGLKRAVDLYVPEKRAERPALLITLHGTNGEGRSEIARMGAG